MKVRLPRSSSMSPHPWNRGLMECLHGLRDYGLAEVEFIDAPKITGVPRAGCGNLVQADERWIYLDTWDHSRPLDQVLKYPEKWPVPIDAAIKIQKSPRWNADNPRNVPVRTWTMFHMDQMDWLRKVDRRRKEVAVGKKIHGISFSGRVWNERKKWMQAMRGVMGAHVESWEGRRRSGSVDGYVSMLAASKAAFIIQGKHDAMTDGKNRREVECASLGVPMVLNYEPFYELDPLIPGEHYVKVDRCTPGDIAEAAETAWTRREELTEAARDWWDRMASRKGVALSFFRLLADLFGPSKG